MYKLFSAKSGGFEARLFSLNLCGARPKKSGSPSIGWDKFLMSAYSKYVLQRGLAKICK
jgi:hypothetical protein